MSQVDTRSAETLRTLDPVVLGSRLRAARVARGWTQSDLAGDTFSTGYVSRIETGARRPTMTALAALADRLEVTVGEIVQGASEAELDEIRLGLNYAELALQNGEPVDAEHQARLYVVRAENAPRRTSPRRAGSWLRGRWSRSASSTTRSSSSSR